MPSAGSVVRVDRVVAVAAVLRDGREQLGSGYLVSGRLVLTAEHCIRDKVTGEPAAGFRVVRASDGAMADVVGVVPDRGLDVAVLKLADNAPWDADLPPTVFARVDQSHSGMLKDCTGIGFPLFQRDPVRRTRHTSEFHGTVYQTDERESGRLLMREPLIRPGPVANPEGETLRGRGQEGPSPWGGLSGTVMFYRGCAIGVVVEHHPRQGDSALHAIGFEQIAASTAIGQCLGLSGPDNLPWVSEQAAARVLLAGWPLAEVRDPFVLEVHRPVQPEDPQPGMPVLPAYVPRDHDTALGSVVQAAAEEGRSGIAVLVGGSSTGKTRACWEALQLLRDRPGPWRLWHPIDPVPSGGRAARAAGHRAADRGVAERGPVLPRRRGRAGRAGRRRAAGAAAGPGPRPGASAGHAVAPVLGRADCPAGRQRSGPACPGAGTAGRPRHHRARDIHPRAAAAA